MRQTLVTYQGHRWTVEYRESESLSHIDGFLMTYDDTSCIILGKQLSAIDKARGRMQLLDHLRIIAIGTSSLRLWYATEDQS